jgi:hypothetical protein
MSVPIDGTPPSIGYLSQYSDPECTESCPVCGAVHKPGEACASCGTPAQADYHYEDKDVLAAIANTEHAKEKIAYALQCMTVDQKWSLYRAVVKLASAPTQSEVKCPLCHLSMHTGDCSGPLLRQVAELQAERDSLRKQVEEMTKELKVAEDYAEALEQKYAGCPHQNNVVCACSYDQKNDVCSVHSPQLATANAKIAAVRELLERPVPNCTVWISVTGRRLYCSIDDVVAWLAPIRAALSKGE